MNENLRENSNDFPLHFLFIIYPKKTPQKCFKKENKSSLGAETIGVSRQISWSIVWIILFCSRPVVSLNTISPPLLLHNSEVNLFNREQPPNRLLVAITAHQSQFSFGIQSIHTSDSQLSLLKIWSCDPFLSQHLCAEMLFLICQFPPSQFFFEVKCKTENCVIMYITTGTTLKTIVLKYGGCKKHISELN